MDALFAIGGNIKRALFKALTLGPLLIACSSYQVVGAAGSGEAGAAGYGVPPHVFPDEPGEVVGSAARWGCTDCRWSVVENGIRVSAFTAEHPVLFSWAEFETPQDLRDAIIRFPVKNLAGGGQVMLSVYALSQVASFTLRADGARRVLASQEDGAVLIAPGSPESQELGFDAARITEIGLAISTDPETAPVGSVAPVLVRGMRFGP
jgi:hypothetical protein